jgi:two-component system cell cycle sensor histidine kinase PleC
MPFSADDTPFFAHSMSPVIGIDPSGPASPEGSLAQRHLEIAARYLYTNLLPFPLIVIGFALLLHIWHPVTPLAIWAAATIAAWIFTINIFRSFLGDPRRGERLDRWALIICATLFVSTACFVSIAPLFWVEGDRLNNILLYVVIAAGLASAGAQAAPSLPVVVSNVGPYSLVFLYTSLAHEVWPINVAIAVLQILFIVLVGLYAHAGWRMTHEMLLLRDEKRSLIARLENALEVSTTERARAERASLAKSEFLANMSHELRTPLNAILGFSDMLREDAFAPKRREYSTLIHDSGQHLLALINDILDLARIEAGRLALREEAVKMSDLATECIELIAVKVREGKTAIVTNIAPGLPNILADARAMKQIMLNLTSNAVKFTPPGGMIVVFARLTALGEMAFGVEDSGIGIAEEDQLRVFESFGQGRHDAVAADKGTGLGLPIVRGLAAAHGGSVSLQSRLNEGTCVTVFMPAERVLSPAVAKASA